MDNAFAYQISIENLVYSVRDGDVTIFVIARLVGAFYD